MILVRFGVSGEFTRKIITSSDGVSWTVRLSEQIPSAIPLGITYSNGTYIAVGQSGTVLTSTNGTTWAEDTSGITNNLWGVTYGNGILVALGGKILTSPNGATWTDATSGITFSELYGVTYDDSNFIAVGTLSGECQGTFEGTGIFIMPGGAPLTIQVQGTYVTAITMAQDGQISWNGSWQEVVETGGSLGVHEGYGGNFSLTLGSEPQFPFSISGTPSGGGSYRDTATGADIIYSFTGSYSGTVNRL